ncbi:hypothetical protein GP486_002053 [Trichoglossum hirsutum]|uniref:Uncharacterized protein n=1 Tax=Trichoglossum hirsutum TaxID=265104 RepID=A0A9P8RSH3_9PEZI|nr:hypothetical protein GP486_002053 [Trichoglossum hirsutum]
MVIGVQSGHIRTTKSRTLGRLLCVLNDRVDADMNAVQPHVPPDAQLSKIQRSRDRTPLGALRISVFETVDDPVCKHRVPSRDFVWFSGFAAILLQLAIATVPTSPYQEWETLFITTYGNTLALLEGPLPQRKEEKGLVPNRAAPPSS